MTGLQTLILLGAVVHLVGMYNHYVLFKEQMGPIEWRDVSLFGDLIRVTPKKYHTPLLIVACLFWEVWRIGTVLFFVGGVAMLAVAGLWEGAASMLDRWHTSRCSRCSREKAT